MAKSLDRIAGAFDATWNNKYIGNTRTGFDIMHTHHHQPVIVDAAGQVPIDGVIMGTEVAVRLHWTDYQSIAFALQRVAMDASGHPGTVSGVANVGRFHVNGALVQELKLTPVAGTSAGDSETEWVFPYAIVISQVDVLLSSRLREGPCTFYCYPKPVSGGAGSPVGSYRSYQVTTK